MWGRRWVSIPPVKKDALPVHLQRARPASPPPVSSGTQGLESRAPVAPGPVSAEGPRTAPAPGQGAGRASGTRAPGRGAAGAASSATAGGSAALGPLRPPGTASNDLGATPALGSSGKRAPPAGAEASERAAAPRGRRQPRVRPGRAGLGGARAESHPAGRSQWPAHPRLREDGGRGGAGRRAARGAQGRGGRGAAGGAGEQRRGRGGSRGLGALRAGAAFPRLPGGDAGLPEARAPGSRGGGPASWRRLRSRAARAANRRAGLRGPRGAGSCLPSAPGAPPSGPWPSAERSCSPLTFPTCQSDSRGRLVLFSHSVAALSPGFPEPLGTRDVPALSPPGPGLPSSLN